MRMLGFTKFDLATEVSMRTCRPSIQGCSSGGTAEKRKESHLPYPHHSCPPPPALRRLGRFEDQVIEEKCRKYQHVSLEAHQSFHLHHQSVFKVSFSCASFKQYSSEVFNVISNHFLEVTDFFCIHFPLLFHEKY